MKRAGPLRRKTTLKKGSGLRNTRDAPRRQNRELDSGENDWSPDVRAEVRRRSGGLCEWAGCNATASSVHHRKLRRHGDHTATNALHLCEIHHADIHAHPLWAYEHGYLVRSTLDPAERRPIHGCELVCDLRYHDHPSVKVELPNFAVRS